MRAAITATLLVALWLLVRAERHRVDGDPIGWPRPAEYAPAAALYTPRGARYRRAGTVLLTGAVVAGLATAVLLGATGRFG